MLETILYLIRAALLLLFGAYLSVAFAGISFTRKNLLNTFLLCIVCGILQTAAYVSLPEDVLWKVYPLNTHLPLILFLYIVYHKKLITALVSVFTAYLWCQPAKWFGVLVYYFSENIVAEYFTKFAVMGIVAFITLKYLAGYFAVIYNKDTRSVCIFGIMPITYYIFDYGTIIYTDLWLDNNRIVAEFLPFFLGIAYTIFCFMYYKEYEQKLDIERKEQLIRITTDSQLKEFEAIKRSEQELRLLRHDMRLLLTNVAVCIDNNDSDKAKEIITTYSSLIENTKIKYFCQNETLNYVLSHFATKCNSQNVRFIYTIELEELTVDEVLFSSILSNALDNALNAQKELSVSLRTIRLILKSAHNKLLLSVENPVAKQPLFSDGLPVTNEKGHGYGTQSIRYMTEHLGGNCQFFTQDNTFTLRVII